MVRKFIWVEVDVVVVVVERRILFGPRIQPSRLIVFRRDRAVTICWEFEEGIILLGGGGSLMLNFSKFGVLIVEAAAEILPPLPPPAEFLEYFVGTESIILFQQIFLGVY